MTFWQLMLIINAIIGLIVLIYTIDIGLQVGRIMKAQNIEYKQVSLFQVFLNWVKTFFQCFCPIYNILVLISLAFVDRYEVINQAFYKLQKERECSK